MKPMKRKGKSGGEPLYHKCSVLGCGCTKSYLYYRSDSQAGGVYLCDGCASEIVGIYAADNAVTQKHPDAVPLTEVIQDNPDNAEVKKPPAGKKKGE